MSSAAIKVLIVLTSHSQFGGTGGATGYYLSEVSHPYHELQQAGIGVDLASIKGGKAPLDPRSLDLDDPSNAWLWNDPSRRAQLENTLALEDVDSAKYQAVLFAGGHGTMWDFRESPAVARVGAAVYENGGAVAAVCHGPAALLNIRLSSGAYLISGKEVTGFSNAEEKAVKADDIVPYSLEDELKAKGAQFSHAGLWQENVVVSDRLLTGQNPASAKRLGQELVRILRAK